MKKGYTLAEVLITLAIIAIISAITVPIINKFKPDANKVMYLKTYDSIVEAIIDAENNSQVYSVVDAQGNTYAETPFANTDAGTLPDGTRVGGSIAKFCEVMANSFNIVGNYNCPGAGAMNAYQFRDSYNDANAFSNPSFTAANGVQFVIYSVKQNSQYRSDIYFDVNGNKGPNCRYDVTNCPKPDRFTVYVNARGQVMPADPVGETYLSSRAATQNVQKYETKGDNYTRFNSSNYASNFVRY